jgi:tripartite-type tricarboxylate transporter receptor subunit TctC
VGRLIAEKMSEDLGQQIIIENVGGAGGTLGAQQVATLRPMATPSYSTISAWRRPRRSTGNWPSTRWPTSQRSGLVTEVPMTVVARADFEPTDMASFVQYVKDNADTITLANAGIGAASHLCGMLLMQALEAPIVTVPYRGTGPAMTELVGGQIDIMCDQTTNTTEQIRGGTIKAYAVTTPERLEILPDLPTTEEAGLSGMGVSVWHGIYAPAGTPQEAVDRLSTALQAALADPDIGERLAELGTTPSPAEDATPAALETRLSQEIERWRPVIEEAGVYAD